MTDYIVTYGLYLTYAILIVAALSAIVFPIIQMFGDLKKAKTAFIGIGAVAVVCLLCWVLAPEKPFSVGDINVSEERMRMVEAGLYVFYILMVTSVAAILYSAVSRYFK